MTIQKKKVRALGLCSGGLDSMVSALVLKQQGVHVEWICFETPFFSAEKSRKASEKTGIPLIVRSITPVFLQMLKNPSCGYGRHMNPCPDCHALMFHLAGEMMSEGGYDFLFSGEVLGQRPMSQTRSFLRYVEKNSGFEGYILRPLSAKRLPRTIPEDRGWVDRDALYGIEGRSRKVQRELAGQMGIVGYPNSGGGCLLTEKVYANRLKDLFTHQEICREEELHSLKYGRHFRLNPQVKLIIGRDRKDNKALIRCHAHDKDTLLVTRTIPGPVGLIPNGADQDSLLFAAKLCAGYAKDGLKTLAGVTAITPSGRLWIETRGISPRESKPFRIETL